MSLGPVMLDLSGLQLTQEEAELLQHPLVGGVIFFSRNYHSPEQLLLLISEIKRASKRRLLLGVDHEGGRVQRFREGFTVLPPARLFGQQYDADPAKAKAFARECAWLMAAELLSYEIDISFAPVLDLDLQVSKVIGDRSFHAQPQVVSDLASAYIEGMQQAGMAATGKHFPGHGAVAADSHTEIPKDPRNYQTIFLKDIQPFAHLIKHGLGGIMPAHVIYTEIDPLPAGFSSYWLQRVLRQQLGFKGVIFSDDLAMAGASMIDGFADRAKAALAAGCDMILVCNHREGAIQILDNLSHVSTLSFSPRLPQMYGKFQYSPSELSKHPRWQNIITEINVALMSLRSIKAT